MRFATSACLFFIALISVTQALASDNLETSGFARVVVGYMDNSDAAFEGYEDELSLSEQSLIALQADYYFTPTLSIAAQVLAHSGEERESGIEWAYLNYEPNQNWHFKAGKLRTAFFRYSDVIDVGFAYPWITPPQPVYSAFLFSSYDGATATYRFSTGFADIDLEAYWGVYDDSIFSSGEEIPVDVDVMRGFIATINTGNFQIRTSYHQSDDFKAELPGLDDFANSLELAGLINNAESLRFNGTADSYQFSAAYDGLDYFGSFEWIRIDSDILLVPEIDSYYFTLGYNYHPFQFHVSLATSDMDYDTVVNEIPTGITPELDQLSFAYDAIVANLPVDNLNSYTFGVRWDFRANMALKAEITFLEADEGTRGFFEFIDQANFDGDANLYQFGLEWVF